MKKGLLFILALLYLVSVTGATLYTHFCMGRLAGWGFTISQEETCGKCGMDKQEGEASGCCKDRQELVKNDNDHQGIAFDNIKDRVPELLDLPVPLFRLPVPLVKRVENTCPNCHAPPWRSTTPLFILHQLLLI